MRYSYIKAKVENVYHNFPPSTIFYHHVEKFNRKVPKYFFRTETKMSRNPSPQIEISKSFSQDFVDVEVGPPRLRRIQKSLYLEA
jgi:hypothetical protein